MTAIEKAIFNRTELLVGEDAMSGIAQKRVIIFGVGGVGSWCAESLVRSGIRRLTIVDSDRVCITNVNRQLMATMQTVGMVKVEALRQRLLQINPKAEVEAVQEIYTAGTAHLFNLDDYDFVIDAIDSLKDKATLILNATRAHCTFFSSMGAALKIDPTQIRVSEFWKVEGCPLARALRRKFKHNKEFPARKFLCVYSPEVQPNRGQQHTCGTAHCLCPKAPPVSRNNSGNGNAASNNGNTLTNNGNAAINNGNAVANNLGREDLLNHEWCSSKAQINGTFAHTTAIFGFMIAGLVMQKILGEN